MALTQLEHENRIRRLICCIASQAEITSDSLSYGNNVNCNLTKLQTLVALKDLLVDYKFPTSIEGSGSFRFCGLTSEEISNKTSFDITINGVEIALVLIDPFVEMIEYGAGLTYDYIIEQLALQGIVLEAVVDPMCETQGYVLTIPNIGSTDIVQIRSFGGIGPNYVLSGYPSSVTAAVSTPANNCIDEKDLEKIWEYISNICGCHILSKNTYPTIVVENPKESGDGGEVTS